MREIIAALARTAVAALLTGPVSGLNVAASEAIALAAGTGHRQTYEDILRRLRRNLEEFARSELCRRAAFDSPCVLKLADLVESSRSYQQTFSVLSVQEIRGLASRERLF
jgi:hypothetical protein